MLPLPPVAPAQRRLANGNSAVLLEQLPHLLAVCARFVERTSWRTLQAWDGEKFLHRLLKCLLRNQTKGRYANIIKNKPSLRLITLIKIHLPPKLRVASGKAHSRQRDVPPGGEEVPRRVALLLVHLHAVLYVHVGNELLATTRRLDRIDVLLLEVADAHKGSVQARIPRVVRRRLRTLRPLCKDTLQKRSVAIPRDPMHRTVPSGVLRGNWFCIEKTRVMLEIETRPKAESI